MVDAENRSFLNQIKAYKKIRPQYETFCEKLKDICKIIVKEYVSEDDFIIQARTKSISSFADKISRPDSNYSNPLVEITDLCGVRIILSNLDQVKTANKLVHENFFIDIEDEDEMDILESQEGGSLTKHFIVQLLPQEDYKNKYKFFDIEIDEELLNLKAEIQVRTVLQHGWALNQYDDVMEKKFKIPDQYLRELNQSAALLEIADASLTEIHNKLSDYESNFPAYMNSEQIQKDIEKLEVIYSVNKTDFDLANRIAKMSMVIEDWDKAIKTLEFIMKTKGWDEVPSIKSALIQKELGIALYKKYKKDYSIYINNLGVTDKDYKEATDGFQKAHVHLTNSTNINPNDPDAFASLGGYWKDIDNERALESYKKALDISPDDPYSLGNYIILRIQRSISKKKRNYLKIIDTMRGAIEKGIIKRKKQIKVKLEIPWAFFDVGLFSLYLGKVQDALLFYLKGIRFSQENWMIETTLKTLNGIKDIQEQLPGLKDARIMLMLALYARKITDKINEEELQTYVDDLQECGLEEPIELKDPIVIFAGGTIKRNEKLLGMYKDTFIKAFKNYKGTLISGGTPSGIAGIVGDLQEKYPKNITSIGYKPQKDPNKVKVDERYTQIRKTKRTDFSIFETFQTWFDILRSGVQPNQTKLIGINGGKISALEFRLAIALGAQVAIVKDSGRAASELINDREWRVQLEPEGKPIRLFKVVSNSADDVIGFLTKPFIIDPDIENLRLFFMTDRSRNLPIYTKEFVESDLSKTLLASLLEALDLFADEIKLGNIASVNSENGCITGGFLSNNVFKVVFILFKKPSKSLEIKITETVQIVDEELADLLAKDFTSGKVYKDHEKISEIFTGVFGQEIQKFFKRN